ncbi:MAG: zinc metallopeptidase [Planctomycetota bacterium]|nr:MAG: zinc metallopeptidase [Planctomycetota bacterium]REK29370.1 MAG: zinc metallopeptidase [Planctomycetota bacterium]REK46799.1 MAG: zinc metallopeptidase [Planctomycetota bacterium]
MLLGMWAQFRIKSTYAEAQKMPAPLSGAAAAKHIVESAGIHGMRIEQVPGHLSDHYDPREKVLRLSPEVYSSRSLAAVGIAAHEAGHAIQDARNYAPLTIRNAVVPAAGIGSNIGMLLFIVGLVASLKSLIWVGIALFSAVVFFQLVNLPVEFNASTRAKAQLVSLGIVPEPQMVYVNRVLNAAALTYVAATLQAVLTLLYLVMRGNSRS